MKDTLVFEGTIINLEKVEYINVVKVQSDECSEKYNMELCFDSGNLRTIGSLDRTNALVTLSKIMESSSNAVSYILDTTAYKYAYKFPTETADETTDETTENADVQESQTE